LPINFKLCSFDCIYCQYGWTDVCTTDIADCLGDFPTPDNFAIALESALRTQKEIYNITFSGNGEPTLHPRFERLVNIARELKQQYFPQARLGILSNSSTAHNPRVFSALTRLDFKIMKLDAGSPETFRRINRPGKGVDYASIVGGLKSLENVTLQTMFIDGTISNIGEREVSEWTERVGEMRPLKAQIYSLHRPPAEQSLCEVPIERLREIATQAEKATRITVEVFIAKTPYQSRPR